MLGPVAWAAFRTALLPTLTMIALMLTIAAPMPDPGDPMSLEHPNQREVAALDVVALETLTGEWGSLWSQGEPSLDIDDQGRPLLAFEDSSGDLALAYNTGTSWIIDETGIEGTDPIVLALGIPDVSIIHLDEDGDLAAPMAHGISPPCPSGIGPASNSRPMSMGPSSMQSDPVRRCMSPTS